MTPPKLKKHETIGDAVSDFTATIVVVCQRLQESVAAGLTFANADRRSRADRHAYLDDASISRPPDHSRAQRHPAADPARTDTPAQRNRAGRLAGADRDAGACRH